LIRYILDTDSVSLFQGGHPVVMKQVKSSNPQEIAVTIITIEEQIYGRLNRIRRANSTELLVLAYAKLHYTWDFFRTINLTVGEYAVKPGKYEVVVLSSDSSRVTPFKGTWDLSGGDKYSNCFYIVTKKGF
jgi:hypothetical protein